jgi:hypothetical protein
MQFIGSIGVYAEDGKLAGAYLCFTLLKQHVVNATCDTEQKDLISQSSQHDF